MGWRHSTSGDIYRRYMMAKRLPEKRESWHREGDGYTHAWIWYHRTTVRVSSPERGVYVMSCSLCLVNDAILKHYILIP